MRSHACDVERSSHDSLRHFRENVRTTLGESDCEDPLQGLSASSSV